MPAASRKPAAQGHAQACVGHAAEPRLQALLGTAGPCHCRQSLEPTPSQLAAPALQSLQVQPPNALPNLNPVHSAMGAHCGPGAGKGAGWVCTAGVQPAAGGMPPSTASSFARGRKPRRLPGKQAAGRQAREAKYAGMQRGTHLVDACVAGAQLDAGLTPLARAAAEAAIGVPVAAGHRALPIQEKGARRCWSEKHRPACRPSQSPHPSAHAHPNPTAWQLPPRASHPAKHWLHWQAEL